MANPITQIHSSAASAENPTDKQDYRFTVLGEDNFVTWRWQIRMILESKGWLPCIEGTCPDASKNRVAATFLASTLSEQNMQRVINCTTAREIWIALETMFENKSSTERAMLMERFTSFKVRSLRNIGSSIGELQALAAKLRSLKANIDEEFIVSILLKALPDSMKVWKSTWLMVNAKEPKLNQLITSIMAEINTMKIPEDTALMAMDKPQERGKETNEGLAFKARFRGRNNRNGPNKRNNTCHYCKKPGHWIRECRKRKADEESKNPGRDNQGVAMMALEYSRGYEEDSWIADSGSSFHMTSHLEWLQDYSSFTSDKLILLGDNRRIPAKGSGFIKTSFGKLQDVHYVPDMSANLFSISAAASKGIEALYTRDVIQLMKSGVIILTGIRTEGIYTLNFTMYSSEGKAFTAASVTEWHQRFGHVSSETINQMSKNKAVNDLNIVESREEPNCVDCLLGKCKRASHPDKTTFKADKPAFSLHFDTVGPFKTESLALAKYMLLCKDEASSYRLWKPVVVKSEIPQLVKQLIAKAKVDTHNDVVQIVTDNGTEFVNSELGTFLKEKGIWHTLSVPYTPQQNGFIERDIRTIIESARTMLAQSRLPKELWPEAVNTAIYVMNRTTNSRDHKTTPYEKWYGKKPSVRNLHVFGQRAIVRYNDYGRSKWDCKGIEQRFVGYTSLFNTYRFYDPHSKQVYESCDAAFIKITQPHRTVYNLPYASKANRSLDIEEAVNDEPDPLELADLTWDHEGLMDSGLETFRESTDPNHNQTVVQLTSEQGNQNDENPSHETPSSHKNSDRHESQKNPVPERRSLLPKQVPTCSNKFSSDQQTTSEDKPALKGKLSVRKYTRRDKIKSYEDKMMPSDIHPGHMLSYKPRNVTTRERYHAKIATQEVEGDPNSYSEAMMRKDKDLWIKAMEEEMESLRKNKVYELVDRPSGNIVTNKWVYKIKRNSKGEVERYKARLVARGFSQVYGIDYLETYAPVANMVSIRMMFAHAAMQKLEMAQFDIKTAFLYGELDETVYMEQPEGFAKDKNKVCHLTRSLYGLKQSPRQWNLKFTEFLKEMNLTVSEHDSCIFFKRSPLLIIAIYVDDGIILARDRSEINRVLDQLEQRFEVHRMEVSTFLGFQIDRGSTGEIALHQTNYITNILKRFDMENCKSVESPIAPTPTEDNLETHDEDIPYREAIGCLMYAAVITRVDIAHAVGIASRRVESPTKQDWINVKRIFRYLKGREHFALVYRPVVDKTLTVYCDADFAGDKATSRSTTGSVFIFGGAPVYWKSQRQSLVTLSSTEAEFVGLCSTVKETVWIRKLAIELNLIGQESTMIYCDNQSAIKISSNEKSVHRTRHMSVQASYPREQMEKGEVKIEHIKAEEQLADMLTKSTTMTKFTQNTKKLMYTAGKLLVATLILLCGIGISDAFFFEKTDTMIWLPMNNEVEIETDMYKLELIHENPCALVLEQPKQVTITKITKTEKKKHVDHFPADDNMPIYEAILQLCNSLYEEKIYGLLRELESDAKKENTDLMGPRTSRKKRAKREDNTAEIMNSTVTIVEHCNTATEDAIRKVTGSMNVVKSTTDQSDTTDLMIPCISYAPSTQTEAPIMTSMTLFRGQRAIPFFLLFGGAMWSLTVATNLLTSLITDYVPWGDGYKIKQLSQRQEKETLAIESLTNYTRRQDIINREIMAKHDQLAIDVERIKVQVSNLRVQIPHAIWAGAYVQHQIYEAGRRIETIIHHAKSGKAATYEMAMLWSLPGFKEINPDDTMINRIDRISQKTLNFEMAVRRRSSDTKVYEVFAFNYYNGIGSNNPMFHQYEGAKYMIHNSSAHCIKAIEDPRSENVHEHCRRLNWKDPKLDHWNKSPMNTSSVHARPQVKRAHMENFIYCYGYNITIDNEEYTCPEYPFKLPVSSSFLTEGHEFQGSEKHIVAKSIKWDPIINIPQNVIPRSNLPEFNAIDRFHHQGIPLLEDKNTDISFTIAREHLTIGLIAILGFVLVLVLIKLSISVHKPLINIPAPQHYELIRSNSCRTIRSRCGHNHQDRAHRAQSPPLPPQNGSIVPSGYMSE